MAAPAQSALYVNGRPAGPTVERISMPHPTPGPLPPAPAAGPGGAMDRPQQGLSQTPERPALRRPDLPQAPRPGRPVPSRRLA